MRFNKIICLLMVLSAATTAEAFFRRIFRIQNHRVTATGRVRCSLDGSYEPVPHVRVELRDDEWIGSRYMGGGRTDENGNFRLTGTGRDGSSGKPDPKIKVIYEYSGTYGHMDIDDFFGWNRYDFSRVKRDITTAHFNIDLNNEHCRAYVRFYTEGLKYYYDTVGRSPPYSKLVVKTNAVLSVKDNAYATTRFIRIPRRLKVTKELAKHEFAHTIRHTYDGYLVHFLYDVTRYRYARTHDCPINSGNYGFAFNEGWAEYWADECVGYDGSDYQVEGNVASALRKLATDCTTSRAKMVEVLKKNPGKIHSFCEFNAKHKEMHDCSLTTCDSEGQRILSAAIRIFAHYYTKFT